MAQSDLARPPAAPWLWRGGVALALFLSTLLVGNALIAPSRALTASMLGRDFLAFYTAGSFIRQGHPDKLYDIDSVRTFEHALDRQYHLGLGDAVGPWWNPPFYVWVFVPLAPLPFPSAVAVWLTLNIAALALAALLLCHMLVEGQAAPNRWKTWALVPLLLLTSMPFIQGFSHGQNNSSSLLILTATVWAWRRGHAWQAGLIAGLLLYKPQVGALIGALLVLTMGWRALAGMAVTGLLLCGACLLWLPGTLATYLHQLPLNVHYMQVENPYVWERHATLLAFWRLLLQGRDPGEATVAIHALWLLSSAIVAAGLALAWWRSRSTHDSAIPAQDRFDPLIAATIAAMPLLMPFYFDYDLLLLALPAVLLGRQFMNSPAPVSTRDRCLVALWAVLFVWLFFNPGVAPRTNVNFTVVLLSVLDVMLIARAIRKNSAVAISDSTSTPLKIAA